MTTITKPVMALIAGVVLAGCAGHTLAATGPYEPKGGFVTHLPVWHPLAMAYEVDLLRAIDGRGLLMERSGPGVYDMVQALGKLPTQNLHDLASVTNPAVIGFERQKAVDILRIDPGMRYECSLARVSAAQNDKTALLLSTYYEIPSAVTGLLADAGRAVSQQNGKPNVRVPVDSCPDVDSLTDELRLASALNVCNAGRVKTALADTRSIDEKIAAAPGVIEFYTVKLARLAPSGLAHILLGNVFGISQIEPCVAKDWSGDPEAFVVAAIDAAKAIVFHPVWMGVLRDVETGVFLRRIHDVAKAIDPATNKPWLTAEQRQRLSAELVAALESKDFYFLKDRKKDSWPRIDNTSWVLSVGAFFNPPDLMKPISMAILYVQYLARLDTNRTKLKGDLVAMASAIARDGALPADLAKEYPVAASEAYQRLSGGQGQWKGRSGFDSLFR
jgi:hypothetical protein